MPNIDFWTKEIQLADKQEEDFRDTADRIYARYRNEKAREDKESRFNILWANTETQRPALYSSTPIPDVRARIERIFGDNPQEVQQREALVKDASLMIERALEFTVDPGGGPNFDEFGQQVNSDFLLAGRAVPKVDYIPHITNTRRKVELTESDGEFKDRNGAVVPREQVLRDDNGVFFELREEEDLVWEEIGFSRISPKHVV